MNHDRAQGKPKPLPRGFSLVEIFVSVAMLALAGGGLLEVLLYQMERAEKTVVDLTLLNIRSGIRFQIADKMIHGQESELERVLTDNPINWLAKPPPGYAGELHGQRARAPQAGEWFFDTERRELGYVPRLRFHLDFAGAEPALRWRTRGVRSPRGDVEDLALVSVTRYTWF